MQPRTKRLIAGGLALAVLVYAVWALIFAESEEDRLAAWLTQLAETMPVREAAAYDGLVDLKRFGLRLNLRGGQDNFGPADGEKFQALVKRVIPAIYGSDIIVQHVTVAIEDDLATAEMTVVYKRGQARESGVQQARVQLDARLVKAEGDWLFTQLSAQPAANPLRNLF